MNKVVNEPIRKQSMLIIRKSLNEWVFPSSSGDKDWTVKYFGPSRSGGAKRLSCNCPSAIYKHSDDRICKHIKYLLKEGVSLYGI